MAGFFQDGDGNASSGRLMKVIAIIVATALAFMLGLGVPPEAVYSELVVVIGLFIGIATSAEFVQKITKT